MEDKTSSGNAAASDNVSNAPAKKTAKSKAKSERPKSSHPPTSEMVNAAIKELKDRKGSSLQAIKKYIASTYKVDGEKLAPFIKRYLKSAVTTGAVVQTKGKGASGSFKLSAPKGSESKSKPKREVRKTESTAGAEKKSAEKKPASQKKTVAVKKPVAAKKPAVVKKPASPKKVKTPAAKKAEAAAAKQKAVQTKNLSKTKKASKAPAAKTRTPKPKTSKSPKAKAAAKK
ncbi:PREDICTED: late histone H1-like [Dufourea novaeangliae]|uniref:Histone H1 n=1 Tax=Dufourea novaeangliae TaxID=178035 RepID=A0A154PLW3_DUFNO|nr:PREDICTED: late histone H1-like [Dufourea novaeangliae]KZC12849.1 Histone H1 [Dufourea novaeangliae]